MLVCIPATLSEKFKVIFKKVKLVFISLHSPLVVLDLFPVLSYLLSQLIDHVSCTLENLGILHPVTFNHKVHSFQFISKMLHVRHVHILGCLGAFHSQSHSMYLHINLALK